MLTSLSLLILLNQLLCCICLHFFAHIRNLQSLCAYHWPSNSSWHLLPILFVILFHRNFVFEPPKRNFLSGLLLLFLFSIMYAKAELNEISSK